MILENPESQAKLFQLIIIEKPPFCDLFGCINWIIKKNIVNNVKYTLYSKPNYSSFEITQ